jgi:hypothetical protein
MVNSWCWPLYAIRPFTPGVVAKPAPAAKAATATIPIRAQVTTGFTLLPSGTFHDMPILLHLQRPGGSQNRSVLRSRSSRSFAA